VYGTLVGCLYKTSGPRPLIFYGQGCPDVSLLVGSVYHTIFTQNIFRLAFRSLNCWSVVGILIKILCLLQRSVSVTDHLPLFGRPCGKGQPQSKFVPKFWLPYLRSNIGTKEIEEKSSQRKWSGFLDQWRRCVNITLLWPETTFIWSYWFILFLKLSGFVYCKTIFVHWVQC